MIDEKKLIEDLKKHFDALYKEDGTLLQNDHICISEDVEDLIKFINEQPKTDWIPCKVGNLIDKIFSHNEVVALWCEEKTDDVRYDKQIWRGMAWDVPKVYKECKFIKIFGTVPESIVEADTINIRIELSEEAKLSMHRKETREPITPAYAYKKEGAGNG